MLLDGGDEGDGGITGTEVLQQVGVEGKEGACLEELRDAVWQSLLWLARSLSRAAAASARVMLGPLAGRSGTNEMKS